VSGVHDARQLSAAFRHVAKSALPSIVAIETRGKAHSVASSQGDEEASPFGDNSPFGDLFKNDPRFKDMFKSRPRETPRTHGMGSGFIIDPSGIILTNNHVVADADQVKVKLWDGSVYSATSIKTDPRSDVAIVRIKTPQPLQALPLGDSDTAEIGDWVLAVGSPFGLDLSVTAGIISAKGRGPGITEREDFLQTDAAINPGNSGGPLLNLDGQVIGINTAISSRSGGFEGIGFAIPIKMADWVGRQLIEKGAVIRGYLGIAIQPVDFALAQQFKIPVGQGAIVSQVMPGSPASEANVQPGDVILRLNGKNVSNPRNLQGIVEQLKIGSEYPLEVLRDGKETSLPITIKEMPQQLNVSAKGEEEAKPEEAPQAASFEELGLEIQPVTKDLTRQLGYKDAVEGVAVSSVKDDSPAAAAGLRTGMIIEKVGSKKVATPDEFRAALKDVSVENGILMLVRSPRGTQFLVVKKEK
jgi:serine protease Do